MEAAEVGTAMQTSRSISSRHLLLIVFLIAIYLMVALIFLTTYSLSRPLGTIPAVAISAVTSLATLALGARSFWQLAIKMSKG